MIAFQKLILVLLGPPGAGKGTQANLLNKEFKLPHLSTGDILRSCIANRSKIGKKANKYMHAGELVPDEIIFEMVQERLKENDCSKGAVFDGFPRNLNQTKMFLNMNFVLNADKLIAILIDIPDNEVVKRLSNRRYCPNCNSIYNLIHKVPKKSINGIFYCDECGEKLEIRDDDKVDTIKKRLKVYHESAQKMLELFKKKSLLKIIDGCQTKQEIFTNILKIIEER